MLLLVNSHSVLPSLRHDLYVHPKSIFHIWVNDVILIRVFSANVNVASLLDWFVPALAVFQLSEVEEGGDCSLFFKVESLFTSGQVQAGTEVAETIQLLELNHASFVVFFSLNQPHWVGVTRVLFIAFFSWSFNNFQIDVVSAQPLNEIEILKVLHIHWVASPCCSDRRICFAVMQPDHVAAF